MIARCRSCSSVVVKRNRSDPRLSRASAPRVRIYDQVVRVTGTGSKPAFMKFFPSTLDAVKVSRPSLMAAIARPPD